MSVSLRAPVSLGAANPLARKSTDKTGPKCLFLAGVPDLTRVEGAPVMCIATSFPATASPSLFPAQVHHHYPSLPLQAREPKEESIRLPKHTQKEAISWHRSKGK